MYLVHVAAPPPTSLLTQSAKMLPNTPFETGMCLLLPRGYIICEFLAVRRRWGDYSGKPEVAQLELVAPRVHEKVFRLDIPVNDAVVVAPVYRAAQLVNVALHTV